MSIHIEIHKIKVNNSDSVEYNNKFFFLSTDFSSLIDKIDKKKIILDHLHTFFVKEINSDKIFRIYVTDFRAFKSGGFISFKLLEQYTQSSPINIAGTIVFI